MRIFCLLFNTSLFVLLPWLARQVTPTWSTIFTWLIGVGLPHVDYPGALQVEYRGLESIIADTAFLSPLSHDITIGSIAIEDLLKVVMTSKLNGRNALSEQLLALRNETRGAAYNLQSLQVKTNAVIDRWVLVTSLRALYNRADQSCPLCSVLAQGDSLLKGFEGRATVQPWQLLMCKLVIPTALMPSGCIATLRLPVQFRVLLDSFESSLVALISLTFSLEEDLQQIQMRLDTIREISTSEASILLEEKHSVLAELWTIFGGNRQHLAMLDRNLKALRMIYEYHGLANRCVSSTQQELRGMRIALDELRPLASGAILLEGSSSLDAIMEQIRSGGERLLEKQSRVAEGNAGRPRVPIALSSSEMF